MDSWQVVSIAVWVALALSLLSQRSARARTDCGQIARVERKLDLILKHLGLELSVEAPARVQELALMGRKVEAIKVLRESNPWMGIKEAKDYVEGLMGTR
jgi:ribosomal protein L7/L12